MREDWQRACISILFDFRKAKWSKQGVASSLHQIGHGTSNAMFYFADLLGDRFAMPTLDLLAANEPGLSLASLSPVILHSSHGHVVLHFAWPVAIASLCRVG